jgi:hypothetical protein
MSSDEGLPKAVSALRETVILAQPSEMLWA